MKYIIPCKREKESNNHAMTIIFTFDGSSKAISCIIDFGFPYIFYLYEVKPHGKFKNPRKPLVESKLPDRKEEGRRVKRKRPLIVATASNAKGKCTKRK